MHVHNLHTYRRTHMHRYIQMQTDRQTDRLHRDAHIPRECQDDADSCHQHPMPYCQAQSQRPTTLFEHLARVAVAVTCLSCWYCAYCSSVARLMLAASPSSRPTSAYTQAVSTLMYTAVHLTHTFAQHYTQAVSTLMYTGTYTTAHTVLGP